VTDPDRDPQKVLTDEILADAERQAERIRTRARRDATQITDKAQAQADAERDDRLAGARDEADRRRQLTLATVPVEVARMRAARIEDILQSIRDEASRQLTARQGFDYRETLTVLAADAVSRVEGEAFVLELAAADAETLVADLAEAVRRRVGRDGVDIIRDTEGRQFWDNSLQGRLARLWPMLRREIAAHVAPEDAETPTPDEKES